MTETVNSVIQAVHQEFATPVFSRRFTIVELANIAKVDRNTIYTTFGAIENVYKVVFEEMMFKKITKDVQTFEDLINNFFDFVSENKSFSFNLYYQTLRTLRHEAIITLLNDLLLKYTDDCGPITRMHLILGYIKIIREWFQEGLFTDSEAVRNEVLDFHRSTFE